MTTMVETLKEYLTRKGVGEGHGWQHVESYLDELAAHVRRLEKEMQEAAALKEGGE